MIPKNVRAGATVENMPGETKAFTIKANGKAFRTLIDGLYSNKVLAVIRELCSNAADSHVAAGNPAPFKVQIPTSLDPTFMVRDYGTGLSHENVMVLYTTIFESTKEETNEQTGQLGLGSKSPFAYTDSFQVTAYDGTEARQYLTFLATDGVPSITHVASFPSTEPTGLEVSFAAKREDIRQFQKEMQFVSLGYDHTVKPLVEGMDLKIPTARIQGKGWAIYPRGSFGDDMRHNHYIRQGSAVYPNDQIPFPHLGYGWISVVTVPIGTANVTASRDALAYDRDTQVAVRNVLTGAHAELTRQVEEARDKAKTRIERAKFAHEYNGILDNVRGSTMVSLEPDVPKKDKDGFIMTGPGERLESAQYWGKSQNTRTYHSNRWSSGFEVEILPKLRILVNDHEVKTVRRIKRIRNAAAYGQVWVLDETDPKLRAEGIAHLKKHLELRDDQFIVVSTLPDDPPAKTVRKPSVKRVLAKGQYWMPRWNGIVKSDVFGDSDRGFQEWPKAMRIAASKAGVTLVWDDVFWVTEKQQEKLTKSGDLPAARRLDTFIMAKLATIVATLPIDDALTFKALIRTVGEYNKALPVVREAFFPNLTIDSSKATEILSLAEIAQVDLRTRPIVAKVEAEISALIDQYPLLFQRSDRKHYEHYIEAVKAKSTPATVAAP